ncbi:MAG: AsmA family protein [Methylophilaceae bacterium]|nr:AsmA family protein [Methylophilaceae bacterium]
MKKHRRILLGAGIALIALVVVPFLIPMSSYIAQAEQAASAALGVPVKIGGLRVAILPTPRLNVSDVVVGNDEDFKVDDVAVVPAIFSIFSDVKTISSVTAKRPVMKKSALDILASLTKDDKEKTSSPMAVTIREISIRQAMLIWPEMNLPEVDIDIFLTPDNKPEAAKFETTDRKLRIDLIPEAGRQLIAITAKSWTLPVGVPLLIDQMEGEMVLIDNKLDMQNLDINLYGGKVNVNAILTWQKDWQLSGKVNVANLQLAKPVSLVSKSTQLSGSLSGDGNFKSTANEPAKLVDVLYANFQFKVLDGVLDGIDLAKAATLLVTKGAADGQTKFDTLSGLLNVSGKQYHLRNLDVVSGLMKATGDVKIKPNKTLDGLVKVEVKKGVSVVAVPLQVSGTVDNPSVFPTKSALAGAAAGTAILGPGVGTSIGIQAADKVKNLFGGGD